MMSLRQITSSLAKFAIGDLRTCIFGTLERQRGFHTSSFDLKNKGNRIPLDVKIGRFRLEAKVDPEKYTMKPLKVAKTGGRGPDGRIWVHRIGGGHAKCYRMIDTKRVGPKEGPPLVERINAVRYDPCRTARIAVAVSGNNKRYILASENMKPGDLIETSGKVTAMPVRASDGDSHPIGSLPLGTLIHNIERVPGEGGEVARAAGTSGIYLRKIGDQCVIRMPSKCEMIVSQECMVTVGCVSNPDHYKKNMHKAGQNRWRGVRPKSGLWQRKTGYHGRKIRPMKAPVVYTKSHLDKPEVFKYSV